MRNYSALSRSNGYSQTMMRFLAFASCLALAVGWTNPLLADVEQTGPVFTVNDPSDPGGATCQVTACSLRAAITAANAGSGDIIVFDLDYPATISLSAELPEIATQIDVAGPGKDSLTISGGGLVRIFNIHSGADVTLTGITLSQGWNGVEGGGAIRNAGTLVMSNVTLVDNLAGGGNGGAFLNDVGAVGVIKGAAGFFNNTGFHDGAISNSGTLAISGTVFSGNRARVGGAIENYTGASATITRSAFVDNVAQISSGGAIANAGDLVIANSTFAQNGSPVGADIITGGTLHVTNSTFYGAITPSMNSLAGGGAGSTVVIRNSILAALDGVDNCTSQPGGLFDVDSSNLALDATCDSATQVTPEQLNLGPLVVYGSVPGMSPLPGSSAIDTGEDAVCSAAVGAPAYGASGLDQRGISRPVGTHCDVGSIEFLKPMAYLPMIVAP